MNNNKKTVQGIKSVMVIGAGIMGQGIIQSFAQMGLSVQAVDISEEALSRSLIQIDNNLKLFKEYNLLEEDINVIKARITPVLNEKIAEKIEDCDYVVETVPENLKIKKKIFAQLDLCHPGIILSSNTSSYPVASIVEGCRTADRMIGIHFYNPAHIMPLVEIHYSPWTSKQTIITTKKFMEKINKKPVVVKKDIPGLIGTRIQLAMAREIELLIAQNVASPEDIDTVAKGSYGFRHACIGNLEAYDMVGLDTMVAVEREIFRELSNAVEPTKMLIKKVKEGELGVKSGRGWFNYRNITTDKVLESQNRRLIEQLMIARKIERMGSFNN